MSDKIVNAKTLLFEDDMSLLKHMTGENHTQDALTEAVNHYLNCDNV